MTRWTEADLEQYMTKRDRLTHVPREGNEGDPDPGPESKLQAKIVKLCDERGWPCLCFPQTPKVKRFLPAGWPD